MIIVLGRQDPPKVEKRNPSSSTTKLQGRKTDEMPEAEGQPGVVPGAEEVKVAAVPAGKLSFPVPGKLEGVTGQTKTVRCTIFSYAIV